MPRARDPSPPPPQTKPKSSSKRNNGDTNSNAAVLVSAAPTSRSAFPGAKFDKDGHCLKHPSVQLANPMRDDDTGKLVFQELKVSCPNCQMLKHKSKKGTSLGGGKVKQGHRVHGAPKSRRDRNNNENGDDSNHNERSARDRSRGRDRSGERSEKRTSARAASKSRERSGKGSGNNKQRHEYDTPFDSKGRCHYHKNVQLAAKKMTGGWKMLHTACPKCMEDKFDDDKSVRSNSSRKSSRSVAGEGTGGDARGQFDKNGCCVLHTHIQVAKKRVFGTGFKVVRTCPACEGKDMAADDISLSSKKSTSSRKSTRSMKSTASRSKPGKASKSGRYGALPFDGDGYCCRHPNVQLAKKKALGGFKIIHDVCPECAEDGGHGSGRKKPSRRKSGTGRVFDDSGSEASSYRSGKSGKSSGARKKRIRVRNLRTEDEEGRPGRYSGDVNDDHQPHGNGVMKYEDGTSYEGVWSEGSKVHGKVKSGGGKSRF